MGVPFKPDDNKKKKEERPEQTQARIARELFSQSDPTRTALFERSEDFLSDPGAVYDLPGFAAVKDTTESQYARARENIIASTPEGGALTSALADLERNRASDLVQGTARLGENELSRSLALSTGTTGAALTSLGSAGAIEAQRDASDAAGKAAKAGGLGQGAGAYFGSK
jgi:hypothetical protein